MFASIRIRFTYANVAATLAVLFAMSGGAYAAGHYLITSTKQISPKVLKTLKGANGANGANGPAGAQGPAGTQGGAGPQGPQGPQGTAGASGKEGAAGKNGTNGKDGKEGSPWTAGGTLPKGATETGTWAVESTAAATEELMTVTISFPIPLATSPNVEFVAAGASTPEERCLGNVEKPGAKPGQTCIFEGKSEVVNHGGLEYAKAVVTPAGKFGGNLDPTGGQLVFSTTKTGRVSAEGTWAVTG